MYRGIAAAKKLKRKFNLCSRKMESTLCVVGPKASPYIHVRLDKQSSLGPYERLVAAQLELIKLKRRALAPPEKGDGSEFDPHQDPIGFIYNDERFPASRNYTPLVQVYNRDEKE
jgi:hypothetical protein